MRVVRVVGLALGALLAGCLGGVSCSSTGETPYDAGSLPDASPWTDAGSSPDAAAPPVADGGDATLPPGIDASLPPGDSGGDSSVIRPDAGGDAARADASDGGTAGQDASDASPADAGDASPGLDASDAAVTDGGDAAVLVLDASDAAPFDAAALCTGFDLAGDAINGITAETSPGSVTLDVATTDPTKNPVPAADSVVVTATTSPIGVMEDVSVGYFTSVAPSAVFVPMSLVPAPGGTNEEWQATIPPIAAGAHVQFWVVGHDFCKTNADAGADYYSNSGANYHYETQ